jgi:hypothetical protein
VIPLGFYDGFYNQKHDRGWSLMTRWIITGFAAKYYIYHAKTSWSYNKPLKRFSPALQNNAGENTIQKFTYF